MNAAWKGFFTVCLVGTICCGWITSTGAHALDDPSKSSGQIESNQPDSSRFLAVPQHDAELKGFWAKDSARNVFDARPAEEAAVPIQYFVPAAAKIPDQPDEDVTQPAQNTGPEPDKNSAAVNTQRAAVQPETALSPREKLLKEFGDPKKETPLKAVETAPAPFKGMLAALDAGDDSLAFDYARQYVRYVHKLEKGTTRAMGLTGLAMEREGLLGENSWQNSPEFRIDRKLLEQSRRDAEQNGLTDADALDSEALAVLRARQTPNQESQIPPAKSTDPRNVLAQLQTVTDDSGAMLREVRKQLRVLVPVDPKRKIGMYFFFKPRQTLSQKMGTGVEQLIRNFGEDRSLEALAVMLDEVALTDELLFRKRAGATYPIVSNPEIGPMFRVSETPTIIFMAKSTGKFFRVRGEATPAFLREVVLAMQGR